MKKYLIDNSYNTMVLSIITVLVFFFVKVYFYIKEFSC